MGPKVPSIATKACPVFVAFASAWCSWGSGGQQATVSLAHSARRSRVPPVHR